MDVGALGYTSLDMLKKIWYPRLLRIFYQKSPENYKVILMISAHDFRYLRLIKKFDLSSLVKTYAWILGKNVPGFLEGVLRFFATPVVSRPIIPIFQTENVQITVTERFIE